MNCIQVFPYKIQKYYTDFLNLILHKKPIAYNVNVNTLTINKIRTILLYNKNVALSTLVDSSRKNNNAQAGKLRTVLNKIPEEIQNAGSLESDWASAFRNNSIK